nr:MAG TPA: hypothetical protein [Caudoviricetes sp.]
MLLSLSSFICIFACVFIIILFRVNKAPFVINRNKGGILLCSC